MIVDLFRAEPARVCAIVAAVVVFVAAKCGVVLDEQSVTGALLEVVPFLLAGEAVRPHVVPLHNLVPSVIREDEVDKEKKA